MTELTKSQNSLAFRHYYGVLLHIYEEEYEEENKEFNHKVIKCKIKRKWGITNNNLKLEWLEDSYFWLYNILEKNYFKNAFRNWKKNFYLDILFL